YWKEVLRARREKYHVVGDTGEPDYDNGWGGGGSGSGLRFWKDEMGTVRLFGTAVHESFSGVESFVIDQMPDGYRPAVGCAFPVIAFVRDGFDMVPEISMVGVTPIGAVTWRRLGASLSNKAVTVDFNTIAYRAFF